MPTPAGRGLSGSANGHNPGAEEKTKARVRESQTKRQRARGRRRPGALTIEYDLPFQRLIQEAADSRGIGVQGYARRAIAAFIAHDLDMPFEEVTANFAAPQRRGEVLRRQDGARHAPEGPTVDTGEGFGAWRLSDR